jgi:Flp pilus assembly secretin CpaC
VLRYLADEAGIPFIGIPESDAANRKLVTFTMEASPFTALESVCRDNGVRLTYDNGVWYMRTVDEERERRLREEQDNRLVGIAYRLKYDPVDRVDFKLDAGGGAQQAATSSGAVTTAASPNLPLQNSQRVFEAKAPRIVNEIRVMLGLPPITYAKDGSVQGEITTAGTTVESTTQANQDAQAGTGAAAPTRLNPTYVPPQVPQVIYNSDTNTLWVVATREQHKWVADYLMAVDQPQALIAIEVKFFETTKDPRKELGINWAGTMQGGYGISVTDLQAGVPGEIGRIQAGTGTVTGTPPVPLNNLLDFKGSSVTLNAPYSAVLRPDDVALSIQAFMADDKTSMVQYPRVLTINNREVAITTAENTPINAGVTQVATGGVAPQNVGTLGYLPVGTQINILPKAVGKDQIALTVAITVSSILGVKSIDLGTGPSDYPITSERVYNAALQVDTGYTLAVGGLEAVDDRNATNGIPVLQDIPGVGELFKSKTRERRKKNLIVFITPTIIPNPKATRGIMETPEAVIPIRPNDPLPPSFTPDGRLVGGVNALNAALAWLDFQVRFFKQINKENRTDKESIRQLRAVIATARMVVTEVSQFREQASPDRERPLILQEERAIGILTELNTVLAAAQDNLM